MSIQLKGAAKVIRKLRLLRAAKGNAHEFIPLVVVLTRRTQRSKSKLNLLALKLKKKKKKRWGAEKPQENFSTENS